MDETLDLIENAGVSTEHLFESILQSPSLQKSLRELDDPADITTIYVNYWKEDRGMSLERFAETEVKVMNEVGVTKGVKFSKTPKASELRTWALDQGYVLLSNKNGIETWGVKGTDSWRLKIKQPSTTPGIDLGSQKWRYSARTKPGEYYDPVTGKTGTRSELGHLDLNPN